MIALRSQSFNPSTLILVQLSSGVVKVSHSHPCFYCFILRCLYHQVRPLPSSSSVALSSVSAAMLFGLWCIETKQARRISQGLKANRLSTCARSGRKTWRLLLERSSGMGRIGYSIDCCTELGVVEIPWLRQTRKNMFTCLIL